MNVNKTETRILMRGVICDACPLLYLLNVSCKSAATKVVSTNKLVQLLNFVIFFNPTFAVPALGTFPFGGLLGMAESGGVSDNPRCGIGGGMSILDVRGARGAVMS